MTTDVLIHLALGALLAVAFASLFFKRKLKLADEEMQRLKQIAKQEAEVASKEIRSKAQLEAAAILQKAHAEQQANSLELDAKTREIEKLNQELSKRESKLEQNKSELLQEERALKDKEEDLKEAIQEYRNKMQELSCINTENLKEQVLEETRRECEDEVRELKQDLFGKSETELKSEAQRLLVTCMQRISVLPHHDINATIVNLPNEEMKGRIIGREGRNIKSFESTTGTTLLIDETPNSVLISSFDPVRREIARISLEHLIKDGRIHPNSIEESVENASEEMKECIIEYGEDTLRKLRISQVHPEVVQLIGKLRYRLANNQNALDHSIEVANLCALIASELEIDTDIAKRAGLFHDIGKSLDAEYEGSHAVAGANILKRTGENPIVVNAVAAHHEEVEEESVYAAIVKVADTVSCVRPGARSESVDSYIQRVRNLETLAKKMDGVLDTYAIQAGREIRVIVSPDKLDDVATRKMARELRRKIEDELQYPGNIKITVIRETRIVEQAR